MSYFPFPEMSRSGRYVALEFGDFEGEPGAIWLDSAAQINGWGKQSLLARQPVGEIKLIGKQLYQRTGTRVLTHTATVYDTLLELDRLTATSDVYAIGFISYEATLELLDLKPRGESPLPAIHFYLYDSVKLIQPMSPPLVPIAPVKPRMRARIFRTLSRPDYAERILRIKYHIREGDIYQANFTCRFDVECHADPFETYLHLRALNPAPYAAYLNFGEYQVLSSSPERMLYRDNALVSTSPIKGTVSVGRNERETHAGIQQLLDSQKDRAEHLMIVDLERNDLGQIAQVGSVSVDNLFRPEVHSSVIHIVSDISARISADLPMSQVFSALLPGGSITGAPKRRAVEIISETEVVPRSVYTGCIGYIHQHRADFNIAIRTIIHQNSWYYVHAGGGIVADSDPALEYQEMLLKARNLFRAIGISTEGVQCL